MSDFFRAAAVGMTVILAAPAFAACDWSSAKKDIEHVLDHDKDKGEEFRKVEIGRAHV